MTYSAIQFNANALYQPVNQTAHGFTTPGLIVRFDGSDFVLADASSEANAEIVGMISSIPTVDSFFITQVGFVSGLTTAPTEGGAYIPGTLYYLSNNPGAGELTAVKPNTPGEVIYPCFIAYTANSGFFFVGDSDLVTTPGLPLQIVTVDTPMVANVRYSTNSGAKLLMTLPASAEIGDIFYVQSQDTGGFRVVQPADVTGILNLLNTTVGVAGYLESAQEGSVLQMEVVVVGGGGGYEYIVNSWTGPITVA